MECAYCLEADANVCVVGACANHCTVAAHPACVASRRSTSVWRNKHNHRDNREWEVCPHKTCHAKVMWKRKEEKTRDDTPSLLPPRAKDVFTHSSPLADACSFLGRDGGPCRRRAVAHGACTMHARDALVLRQMLEEQTTTCAVVEEAEDTHRSLGTQTRRPATRDVATHARTTTRDAGTQTLEDHEERNAVEVEALRARVRELEHDLEAMNLVYLGAAEATRAATLRDAARTLLACV